MNRVLTLFACVMLATAGICSAQAKGQKSVIRGWLSDDGCASGRAKPGVYTGTNPDCAKKCVHDGKRIVLVDPDHKRLLVVTNQEPAVSNVGDYVEISGDLDDRARTVHVDSLKLLEKGRAMCGVPGKKSGT